VLITIPHQPNLNLVLRVDWKRIVDNRSAARSERQSFDVVFLRKIGRNQHDVSTGSAHGAPHGEPADLLRCRQISLEQSRRKSSDTDIVEAITGIVLRKERCNINIKSQ